MTLNNVSSCVCGIFLCFSFLVLFCEMSNPHFHVAALPVLSEHSAGNEGIAKTYVLRFQSVVCSSLFFSSSCKSVLPGSFGLDKERAFIGTSTQQCYLDQISLMMLTHLTQDALKFSRLPRLVSPPLLLFQANVCDQWWSRMEMSRTLGGLGLEGDYTCACVLFTLSVSLSLHK